MSNNQSRCMYCGSTSYGSGCIFSSHRMHIHVDDPTKCIYCGMMAYGSGCIFNPFTRMHVHGMDVGQSVNETVQKTAKITYLIDNIFKDIKDSEAYKLNLVNEAGVLIRTPDTPYEQGLVSPLSNFYTKLNKYVKPDAQTALEALKLLNATHNHDCSVEEYEKKIAFESDIKHVLKQLKNLLQENYHFLSHESIENVIESAIISLN